MSHSYAKDIFDYLFQRLEDNFFQYFCEPQGDWIVFARGRLKN